MYSDEVIGGYTDINAMIIKKIQLNITYSMVLKN